MTERWSDEHQGCVYLLSHQKTCLHVAVTEANSSLGFLTYTAIVPWSAQKHNLYTLYTLMPLILKSYKYSWHQQTMPVHTFQYSESRIHPRMPKLRSSKISSYFENPSSDQRSHGHRQQNCLSLSKCCHHFSNCLGLCTLISGIDSRERTHMLPVNMWHDIPQI